MRIPASINPINARMNPSTRISIYAIVKYLAINGVITFEEFRSGGEGGFSAEFVETLMGRGIDIDGVRHLLFSEIHEALVKGASGLKVNGIHYVINAGVLVTVNASESRMKMNRLAA